MQSTGDLHHKIGKSVLCVAKHILYNTTPFDSTIGFQSHIKKTHHFYSTIDFLMPSAYNFAMDYPRNGLPMSFILSLLSTLQGGSAKCPFYLRFHHVCSAMPCVYWLCTQLGIVSKVRFAIIYDNSDKHGEPVYVFSQMLF